ncbi:MAG: transglycosylase SLT domain-containing protein [Bdellovibrionales bacterium]|nr:transglycosylase SLT domain-containing protein [Bdellovibrionales bacterium]
MKFLFLQFITLILVLGCSTQSTKDLMPPISDRLPPSYQLSSDKDTVSQDLFLQELLKPVAAEQSVELSTQWWAEYKRAMIWQDDKPQISCRLYSKLSKEKMFPLHSLARLRALQTCEKKSFFADFSKENSWIENQPWLKRDAIDTSIKIYTLQKNQPELLKLYWEKSKLSLPASQKINLTKRALDIATQLNDEKAKEKLTKRVYFLSPSEMPLPKKRDYLKVARDYRHKRLFTKSRSYYNKIIKQKGFNHHQRLLAYKGIRKSYKLQLDKENYIKSTENLFIYTKKIYRRNSKKDWYKNQLLDNGILLARTYWTKGMNKQAKNVLTYLVFKLGKTNSDLSKAYWVLGRMAEEESNFQQAVNWFTKAKDLIKPNSHLYGDIHWLLAWNLRKLKKYDESNIVLSEIIKLDDNDFEKFRYQFWYAKNLKQLNKDQEAQNLFEEIIHNDPVGYYGIVARRENQMVISKVSLRNPANATDHVLSRHMNEVYLEWLISLDEKNVARDYLDYISDKFEKEKLTDKDVWLALLNNYARAGQYLSLFYRLNRSDPEIKDRVLYSQPGLIFPQPYYSYVNSAAQKFGMSTEFIYAIMRQESAFNPYARSHADAFGLMQLLPEVAEKSASANQVPYQNPRDLFKPFVNIQIGTSFLRSLYDKYDGQTILAIASYNASEEAIDNWMKTKYRGSSLEFIEDIPYNETQNYVRLVIRNMVYYTLFNTKDSFIKFPEWMLDLNKGLSI